MGLFRIKKLSTLSERIRKFFDSLTKYRGNLIFASKTKIVRIRTQSLDIRIRAHYYAIENFSLTIV